MTKPNPTAPSRGARKRVDEGFPLDVIRLKQALSRNPAHPLFDTLCRLTGDDLELVRMWRAVEKKKIGEDDLWVWGFLRAVHSASHFPPYLRMTPSGKSALAVRLRKQADKLAKMLDANGLSNHLVYSKGRIFHGFGVYEDFSSSNQAGIDAEREDKVSFSRALGFMAKRWERILTEAPALGKAGENAKAIRCLRLLADRNQRLYGSPLFATIATATNAIFGTSYNESSAEGLLAR